MPEPDLPAPPSALPVEERLRRADQALSFHLDNTPIAVIEWDRDHRIVRWAGQAERVFGWTADEVLGKRPTDWQFVHEDDIAAVRRLMREIGERADPRTVLVNRNYTKAGAVVWCEWHNSVIRDADGEMAAVLSLVLDVTERQRADRDREVLAQQLLDAQKWEGLGVLAGGLAHDFNNILTVVLGNAGLARRLVADGSPAAGHLDQIEQACRRAADLCRQMLVYAGRGPTAVGRTDLNRLITEAAPLLEIPAARHARIAYELAPDLPAVTADPAQVRQVLMNLVMNAAEALEGTSGDVTVRTRAVEVASGGLANADHTLYRLKPAVGRYVVLEVIDTGPGMSDVVKARMFDPFFTTKFPGRGLGLAAVLGIVRAHHGGIAVESEPGRGTCVRVFWPGDVPSVTPPTPPEGIPPVAGTRPMSSRVPTDGAGFALVIDDEMFVREVAASTLEELGYEPLVAGDGEAGLAVFGDAPGKVRLAVIDVVMPGMTGDQVLAALRAADPALPVVLISGYSEQRIGVRQFGPRTEFLQKPFHPEDLAAAVRRVTG